MAAQINAIGRSNLTFIKQIGSGGFSSVYQMTWKREEGNIDIAAKRLNRNDKHELNIMSALDHPNIVKLLGVVDKEMDFMLILELCEGGSLRSYLDKHQDKHFPVDEFFSWAKQAATPIKYLRKMKIVHKDIKSPNYMITGSGGNILKLGDFGLAKNIESTISKATESASYHWMAPELLRHGILSPSYDLFSLAVVLWELWTRKFPFKGLESPAILWKVCNDDERPPIPGDCPQWLAELMRQCWRTNYHKRPSIDDIIDSIFKAAATAAVAPTAATVAAAKKSRQLQIINSTWKLEKVFGEFGPGRLSYGMGMAVNLNGDVAIADSHAAQVKVFNTDGEYRFSLDTTQGLEPGTTSYPNQVIVNSNSDYFVTDCTTYIKIYDVDGAFKGKWVPSNPQSFSHSLSLYGLTIDSMGHLLTGDVNNKCINTHRQDGTHITSIKVGIKPYYLRVTSQDTIIVAEWDKPPQIISDTGQVKCTLKHPVNDGNWDPHGMYCYEDIILISNWETDNIICFSVSGEYLVSIDLATLSFPRDLSLVDDGKKLIVCDMDGKKVFARNP